MKGKYNVEIYDIRVTGNIKLSKNFRLSELQCKNGNPIVVVYRPSIEALQQFRDYINKPVHVNSAYRDWQYNKDIKGSDYSQHMYGVAYDIWVDGMAPKEVASLLEYFGFDGIGVYDDFTHGDKRGEKARWGIPFPTVDVNDTTVEKVPDLVTYNVRKGKCVEIEPKNIGVEIVKTNSKNIKGNYVNGTLFNYSPFNSIMSLCYNGKILSKIDYDTEMNDNYDDDLKGTNTHLVVWYDGKVTKENFRWLKNEDYKKMLFCVGGYDINPNTDLPYDKYLLDVEFLGASEVDRKTNHTYLAYHKGVNKIIAFSLKYVQAKDAKKIIIDEMGCEFAIALDGGGSTSARINGKDIKTTTRKLHNIIRF